MAQGILTETSLTSLISTILNKSGQHYTYIIGGDKVLEGFDLIISIIEGTMDTKRKKHIAGGILFSIALLFGGLAFTTFTLKTEENYDE